MNRNEFQSDGGLSTSDLQNRADYNAEGSSFNFSMSGKLGDQSTASTPAEKRAANASTSPGGSAGTGQDSGSASSVTQAAISGIAGNQDARTGDAETGIAPIFDQERVKAEVNAQITITAEFGKQASKAVGDYATRKYNELKDSNPVEAAKWAEGGEYRSLAHALVGSLSGGAAGAAGAGVAALSADALNQLTQDMPEGVRTVVGSVVAAGLGQMAGGSAGAANAFNADINNRQLHPTEIKWISGISVRSGNRSIQTRIWCGEGCWDEVETRR